MAERVDDVPVHNAAQEEVADPRHTRVENHHHWTHYSIYNNIVER
jgi:hypothetical protein